jgi:hypothetical protein
MHRAEEVRRIATAHRATGGALYLVTLTLPHDQGDRLEPLRRAVADSFRYVRSGDAWLKKKKAIDYVGEVRALEVTVGAHGWHPHLHVLLFTARELTDAELADLRAYYLERWSRRVVKFGYRAPSAEYGVTVVESRRDDYLTKMGLADELAKGATKVGRGEGRTPFQVLADFADTGDVADLDRWREWTEGMHGARQLTWSVGLRERYTVEVEKTDTEVVADGDGEAEEQVARVSNDEWCLLVRADPDVIWQLLDLAERGGASAVEVFLAERMVLLRRSVA